MVTRAQIDELVARLVAGYDPDKVILFGSYAYGTPNEHSDIDLCIVKEDHREKILKARDARMAISNNSSRGFGVDLLIYTNEEYNQFNLSQFGVSCDIARKGLLLYEKA
jgi:uncharacterized protein